MASPYSTVAQLRANTAKLKNITDISDILVDGRIAEADKKIEQDLVQFLPRKDWGAFSLYLIDYGREICPAHKHDCDNHPLTQLYPEAADVWPSSR